MIESLIRALMVVVGILGNNWLAIRSLPGKISGIRTHEVLFINLAVSNLMTNYLVALPDTMVDFAGRWFLGNTFCGAFRFFAELSGTSSIYTTLFISAFWHQKLVGSMKQGGAPLQMDSLGLVGCLLAGSWTVAVVFSIPQFFFVSVEGANESHEKCVDAFPKAIARQTYEIFYLTMANALPLAGLVFASVQIVITLLQNQRRIRSHNSDASKQMVKEENESTDGRSDDTSVSTVSGAGTSKNVKASLSPTHIFTGVRPSSPSNRETHVDSGVGAPPNIPRPIQMPAKPSLSSNCQVRAAKSVVAVASVFLVCWLTHLLPRISNHIQASPILLEVASYIAASYTSIIPYIFLHGVKTLSCSCTR